MLLVIWKSNRNALTKAKLLTRNEEIFRKKLGQNALLQLDNTPEFEVKFVSEVITSMLQPLDQGIIDHYIQGTCTFSTFDVWMILEKLG